MTATFHVAPTPRDSQLIDQTLDGCPLHLVNEHARARWRQKQHFHKVISIRGADGMKRDFNELGSEIRAERSALEPKRQESFIEATGGTPFLVRLCFWILLIGAAGTVLATTF